MAMLNDLMIKIRTDLKDLKAGLGQAKKSIKGMADDASTQVNRINKGFTTLTRTIKGLAIAAAAMKGLQMIDEAITKLDDIGKTAKSIGITAEALQELRYAAERSGIATEKMDKALARFTSKMGEAALGKGELIKYLQKYNIAIHNTDGSMRSFEDIFYDVAEVSSKLGTSMEKNAFLAKVFGEEAGPELAVMMEQGRKGIEEQIEAARRLGVIFSNDTVKSAEKARDKLDDLKMVLSVTLTKAIGDNAEAIAQWSIKAVEGISNVLKMMDRLTATWGAPNQLTQLGDQMREIDSQIESLEKSNKRLSNEWLFGEGGQEQIKANNERIALLRQQRDEVNKLRVAEVERIDAVKRANEEAKKGKPGDDDAGGGGGGDDDAGGGDTDAEQDRQDKIAEKARLDAIKEAEAELAKDRQEYESIRIKYLSDEEKATEALTEEYAVLNALLEKGVINAQQFDDLMARRQNQKIDEDLAQVEVPEFETEMSQMERLTQLTQDFGMTFSSAFEDAIFNGGKLSDVMSGLVQDIIKMTIRAMILQPLMTSLFGAGGGAGGAGGGIISSLFTGGKAGGGVVQPGRATLVGERGPELIVPNAPGQVINNGQLGRMGGSNVRVEVVNKGTPQKATGQAVSFDPKGMVVQVIMEDIKRNGPIASGLGSLYGLRRQA